MQKTGIIWGILMVLCGLSACDSSQKASHSESSHSKSSTPAVSASQVSVTANDPGSVQMPKAEASVTSVSTVGSNDTAAKSLCDTVNVNSWMGFDESLETPECKTLKGYQLTSYKCEVSSHAFGLHIDAALIENGEQRIFSYPNEKQCVEAMETRNANAP